MENNLLILFIAFYFLNKIIKIYSKNYNINYNKYFLFYIYNKKLD